MVHKKQKDRPGKVKDGLPSSSEKVEEERKEAL